MERRGGTGIRTTEVGHMLSFDVLGQYPASTYGCRYAAIIVDEASGWLEAYPLRSKADVRGAIKQYVMTMATRGWTVKGARSDAGSETSWRGEMAKAFQVVCAELGLQLYPSAPGD
jgi:hypothetical protein